MVFTTTPPAVGIADSPVHTICINAEWWSHISGIITQLTYREAWEGTDDEISDAIEAIYEVLNVGLPATDCGAVVSYPQHATLWHYQSRILTGGAMTNISLADAPNNIHGGWFNILTYQSTFANADSFEQPFFLAAGDYDFYVLGGKNTFGGKLDWYLDSEVTPFWTGEDFYASAVQTNVIEHHTLTIPTDGNHLLKGVVNGRTSPSGAYFIPLINYWFDLTP